MKRMLILSLAFVFALGIAPLWAQSPKMAAGEKAEMMPKMQEMIQEMEKMLGQEKITPEQKKKMQDMLGNMQGMMTQMHEKMAMPMCPMMKKMEDQAKTIKALEERLDKLEKKSK